MILAVGAGALMTTQARVNGELAVVIDNGFLAAAISFGSGFLVLCIIMLFFRKGRTGYRLIVEHIRDRSLPWWFTLAGSAGAGYVLSQTLVIGVTGVALFTVSFVAGLTIGSLVLDLWGIGPAGHRPLTTNRVLGAALGLVAVVVAVSGQHMQTNGLLLLIMPVTFGVIVAWQQAANGRLTVVAQTPWTSTFINFGVGTGVLLVATAINALSDGLPQSLPTNPWLYIGGSAGVIFIALTAVIVRSVGVLLLSLGSMAGQLSIALVFDAINPEGHPLGFSTYAGTALIFVAVIIATIPRRHKPEHAS